MRITDIDSAIAVKDIKMDDGNKMILFGQPRTEYRYLAFYFDDEINRVIPIVSEDKCSWYIAVMAVKDGKDIALTYISRSLEESLRKEEAK